MTALGQVLIVMSVLNEENSRLMPGCFSNDGTASSPHVPGCKCWPGQRRRPTPPLIPASA